MLRRKVARGREGGVQGVVWFKESCLLQQIPRTRKK